MRLLPVFYLVKRCYNSFCVILTHFLRFSLWQFSLYDIVVRFLLNFIRSSEIIKKELYSGVKECMIKNKRERYSRQPRLSDSCYLSKGRAWEIEICTIPKNAHPATPPPCVDSFTCL